MDRVQSTGGSLAINGQRPATASPAVRSGVPTDAVHLEGYTVRKGDTIDAIARRFGVSPEALLAANPKVTTQGRRRRSADGHWIYPGDVLKIPAEATETRSVVARARAAQSEQPAARSPRTPTASTGAPAAPTAPAAGSSSSVAAESVRSSASTSSSTSVSTSASTSSSVPASSSVSASVTTVAAGGPATRDGGGWQPPVAMGAWKAPVAMGNWQPPVAGPSASAASSWQLPQVESYSPPYSDGYGQTGSDSTTRKVEEIAGGVIALAGLLAPALISTKTEIAIGKNAAKQALTKYPPYTADPRLSAYVQGVMNKLAVHCKRKNIHYQVQIVQSDVPNSFALPGGYIFITTGALKMMDSEAQLAGVLGHEMTHVENRNGISLIQHQLVASGIELATLGETNSPQITSAGAMALKLAEDGLSRQMESAADAGGARLEAEAGYDPNGIVQFLAKIEKIEQPTSELLSDHPTTSKRIAALHKEISSEHLAGGPMDEGHKTFMAMTAALRS